MRQGDFFRVLAGLAIAGAGGAIALVGAELVGELGATTTVEQFVSQPALFTSTAHTTAAGLSVAEIYRLDAPGVVEISATPTHGAGAGRPLGSGFVIDKAGHILTASEVIGTARSVEVSFSGDDEMNARVVGVDAGTGIAVLQVDAHPRALAPLALGDSDDVQVGDPVVAIGNPLSSTRTATSGIISAVQHSVDPTDSASVIGHAIETDAAIGSSSSGGPLIDGDGQVIGVNAAPTASDARDGLEALGFAIPIDTVKDAIAQLIRSGKVEHAYLGLTAIPITRDVARIYNLPSSHGLLVQAVVAGSGASKAGLRAGSTSVVVAGESYLLGGDIIVTADGVQIRDETQLREVIEALAPGDRLRLEIWRANKEQAVSVRLSAPPG
jgi:S1-C subfamily serine protease